MQQIRFLQGQRALKYPQCLHILECLQCNNFREALTSGANAKFIEDQQVLQWLYYLRKRQRLHVNPEAAEDAGEKSQEDTDDDTDGDKTGSDIN
ncbi:SOH1 protein [Ostertagia ostertagi]